MCDWRTHTLTWTHRFSGVYFPAVILRLHLALFISVGWLCDLKPLLSQCFIGSPRGVFTMGTPPPPPPLQLLVLHLQTHKHANMHAHTHTGVHTQHTVH